MADPLRTDILLRNVPVDRLDLREIVALACDTAVDAP